MKATGIVRRVDDLGRVVVPAEVRHALGWQEKQAVEVFVDGEFAMPRACRPGCVGCGGLDGLVQLRPGVKLCRQCAGRALERQEVRP